jgi:hypothetical protein
MRTHSMARVGYDSQYNAKTGYYEYCYVRMGARVAIQCESPFYRGDYVTVESVDAENNVVRVRLEPDGEPGLAPSALMIVSPGFPMEADAQHAWREFRCSTLLKVRAHMTGNMTYIAVILAPLRGRSSLSATDESTGDTFHFFLSERGR